MDNFSPRESTPPKTATKVRWGMGKVEFRPLIPEIREFLADGWPKKVIFEKLQEQGKVNMGYVSFCSFVKKLITEAVTETPPKKARKRKPQATKSAVPVSTEIAPEQQTVPMEAQAPPSLTENHVDDVPESPTPEASTMSTNLFTGSNAASTGENHA